MKLEQQVCGLELAKRLKELGVKQDSFYLWDGVDKNLIRADADGWLIERCYSAFTVAELGEMFPETPAYFSFKSRDASQNNGLFWVAKRSDGTNVHLEQAKTEADARAKMLIYLLASKGEKNV